MELKEFVKNTLIQICEGVKEAQSEAKGMGAIINPVPLIDPQGNVDERTGLSIRSVDFDVALTEQKGTETKGVLGIFFGGMGAGTSGKSDEGRESINRIKFSVPILFPHQ